MDSMIIKGNVDFRFDQNLQGNYLDLGAVHQRRQGAEAKPFVQEFVQNVYKKQDSGKYKDVKNPVTVFMDSPRKILL